MIIECVKTYYYLITYIQFAMAFKIQITSCNFVFAFLIFLLYLSILLGHVNLVYLNILTYKLNLWNFINN